MVLSEIVEDNFLSRATKPSSPISSKTANIGQRTFSSKDNGDARNRVFSYLSTKSTATMLIEAIRVLGNDERGVSVKAITKWIVANYAVLDKDKLNLRIKKAVLKGLNKGSIERASTSKGSLGASGSFALGMKTKSKSSMRKKEKVRNSAKGVILKPKGKKNL